MSILSWLKAVTDGGATADAIHSHAMRFAEGEEQFHGLNMRAALDAHIAWTHRLEAKLNGVSREALEVGVVASDDNCTLGHWIHGAGRDRFGHLPEYETLKHVHAAFHLKAGEVLNEVQNGNAENAKNALKEIRHESGNVQLSLVRLYSKATS